MQIANGGFLINFGGLLHDQQITKFLNSLSNFPDMISLSSNYRVLRSNVHRTMFAPQCFQMISSLLDFDTKVENNGKI